MAYTIKTTASDLYRFPVVESRDEAAKWARQQAKADLATFGAPLGNGGYIENEYTQDGEPSAYVFVKAYTKNASGHHAAEVLGRVEIVEV